jgi:hypothetical protein
MEAPKKMGKEITVLTTFHKPGLEKYGQRMIDSFAKRVDKRIKLLVYAEDCNPVNPDPEQITILNAKQVLPKLNKFKERWGNVPKANGIPPDDIKARRPRDWHKEFKWDAVRFANKVYAVFDACERSKDWCVWMDADSYIHSDWSYENFINLLPDNAYLTMVGRGKGSQTWPECGFYGLNTQNNLCKEFVKEFERVYEDADNGIFTLEEWHDSFVMGDIINKFKQKKKDNIHDYSSDIYIKTAKTGGGGHPLINGPLGKFMDHMKGGRKDKGISMAKDLMGSRQETYWTNAV